MMEQLGLAWQQYWDYLILIFPKIIVGLIVLLIFYTGGRISRVIVKRLSTKFSAKTIVKNFLTKGVSWVFYLSGFIAFMHIIGLGNIINSLLAGAGISAIIFGFAFKDIAENLLSGLLLATQRPFKEGNIIEVMGFQGTVKGIDLRNTHLRNAEGKDFYIPNSVIVKNVLTNYTRDGLLRMQFSLGLDTMADIDKAKTLIINYLGENPLILNDPPPDVVIKNMGVSTLDIVVYFWVNVLKIKEAPGVLGQSLRGITIKEIRDILLAHEYSFPSQILEHKMYENSTLNVELRPKA